ncbi:MAG: hypothetical protein JJT75_02945 [Opitutales bacterium]|nr:hypothetical protein [Opitutales bacterium]MCH8540391.1 hypothetical protein [Opitutales bacterium]
MDIPLEITWPAAILCLFLIWFPSWVLYTKKQKNILFDLYHAPDGRLFCSFLNWQNALDLLRAAVGVYLLLYVVLPENALTLSPKDEAFPWFVGILFGVLGIGVFLQTFLRFEGYFTPNYPFHYQLGGCLILMDPWAGLFALVFASSLVKAFRHYEWFAPGFVVGAVGYAYLFGGLNLLLGAVVLLQGLPLLLALLVRDHLRLLRFRSA